MTPYWEYQLKRWELWWLRLLLRHLKWWQAKFERLNRPSVTTNNCENETEQG